MCDRASAGPALLLGWQAAAERPFGFGAAPRGGAEERPLEYAGDGHLATFAPTGTGKGRGVAVPNLLRHPGPVLAFDPKGELAQVTARRRRELGHRVAVLDPFRVVSDKSDSLNPFDVLKRERSVLECDAEMLASLLAVGHEFAGDRYWNDMATAFVAALLAHIGSAGKATERTLLTLRRLLYHPDLDYKITRLLADTEVKSAMARDEFASYLATPEEKTRPCVKSTATTYVKMLGSPNVAAALGPSSFDLREVADGGPLDVFIVIPPEYLESHQALLRLWVGTLLVAVSGRRRVPRRRTLFLLDEAAALGTFPPLRQAVTLHRGKGLQTWTFWQDLSQVRELYPRDWQALLNNCAVLQAFGLSNHLMARQWSEVLGREPGELLAAGPEAAHVFLRGRGYRRCRRPDYLSDPEFAGQYDANRLFELHALTGP